MKFKKNEPIQWKWLGRNISGKVLKSFTEPTTIEIKGKKIKRNASSENPAYLVLSDAGNQALKLETELSKTSTPKKSGPRLFSS